MIWMHSSQFGRLIVQGDCYIHNGRAILCAGASKMKVCIDDALPKTGTFDSPSDGMIDVLSERSVSAALYAS